MPKDLITKLSKFNSIRSVLLIWFLLLSLVPLSIVLLLSYTSSSNNMRKVIQDELAYTTPLSVNFINNWFSYRLKDIRDISSKQSTLHFAQALTQGYTNSNQTLGYYTKSREYEELVENSVDEYHNLQKTYDYIYDIFIIDVDGNILFSLMKEADFATNLNNGPFSATKFALNYRKVLKDKKVYFSDLEKYKPSADGIFGFISTPILNQNSELIGVFSLQIKSLPIYNNFHIYKAGRKGVAQYLVGEDGVLRSPLQSDIENLVHKIETQPVKDRTEGETNHNNVISYIGPKGQKVIGNRHSIDILGVRWNLITEVDEDVILASTHDLAKQLLYIMLLSFVCIVMISLFISRKITEPIKALSDASILVSQGKEKHRVNVNTKNEIGQLASAFNYMLDTLSQRDKALKEQKLALDVHNIVTTTDLEGNITYANQKLVDISGYTKEELMGANHRIMNSNTHDKTFWKEMYRVISDGKIWHGEICDKTKDGRLFWIDTTILPFLDEEGKPKSYIAIRTDITDRVAKEKAFIQQSRLAQMGEMISMIAHQWRQPLSTISSVAIESKLAIALDTFSFSSEEESQKFKTYFIQRLDDIETYTQNLTHTIDDFRNFYKPNKKYISCSIEKPLNHALKIVEASLLNEGIDLIKELHSTRTYDLFDSEMMQVILNILKNAQDNFAEKKTEKPMIIITTRDDTDKTTLEVCDNGGGIDKEFIEKIFDPYFSTKNEKNGTGLGLYMSKTIVEEHHKGELTVKNHNGGACFTITLFTKE